MRIQLNTLTELKNLLSRQERVTLYGAGYYLDFFMRETKSLDYNISEKITSILVSNPCGNPKAVGKIPVVPYQKAGLLPGDIVILTLGQRFREEVSVMLEEDGAVPVQIAFNMFYERTYCEVFEALKPFMETFSESEGGHFHPLTKTEICAWTCWWQGAAQAPEIVKACWESQRRNLPPGINHVVITRENYRNYIFLPDHIVEKANAGLISIPALSDIIRAELLYQYGGVWFDATLLITGPLEEKLLEFPIYTRNLPETQYCANAMWAGWFLYTKPNYLLFRFLSEAFFYYFSVYDKPKNYFMIDYIIAIACNLFPIVRKNLNSVPFNNEQAMELGKHLTESFNPEWYKSCTQESFVQKLTYKLTWDSNVQREETIYGHLLKEYPERSRNDA